MHVFKNIPIVARVSLSLSSVFPVGDPRRIFGQGTPKQVSFLLKETWEHSAPTPERMAEDMLNLPIVCDKIIAANGSVVPDMNFRSGRRLIREDGKGEVEGELRKSKARKRDRISTVPWDLVSHPSLKEAERLLCGC